MNGSKSTTRIAFISGIVVLLVLIFLAGKTILVRDIKIDKDETKASTPSLSESEERKLQEQVAPLIASGDLSSCSVINDLTYKTVCINNIALQQAVDNNDIEKCQLIDGVMIPKSECEYRVVFKKSLDKSDISICQEASDLQVQASCQSTFYDRQAMANNDISLCDKSSHPDYCRSTFIYGVLIQNPRQAKCDLLINYDERVECEAFKSVFADNVLNKEKLAAACKNFKTEMLKRFCDGGFMGIPQTD